MTDEQFNLMMSALADIRSELQTLNQSVRGRQKAPNYQYPRDCYANFDWSEIEATVDQYDDDGACVVRWGGRQFVRRCKPKFGGEIWFSRKEGDNYQRLIAFGDMAQAEALPRQIRQGLQTSNGRR